MNCGIERQGNDAQIGIQLLEIVQYEEVKEIQKENIGRFEKLGE